MKNIYLKLLRYSENIYLKKINNLLSYLKLENGIHFVDVGAAGHIIPRWSRIESHLNYYGFEPDKRSREELLSQKNYCKNYFLNEKIISNEEGLKKIFLCKSPMNSSVYKPNEDFVKKFSHVDRLRIVKEEKLNSTTIDNLELDALDFIKLDIQGGELNALIGAQKSLVKTLGIEIEVEFSPIYKNQPLFSDVKSFLNEQEFEFIDFLRICRWERNNIYTSLGQATWGDALFLRSPEFVAKNITSNDLIKRYIVICILYNKFDLVTTLIELIKDDFFITKDFNNKFKSLEKRFRRSKYLKELFNKLFKLFLFVDEDIHLFH